MTVNVIVNAKKQPETDPAKRMLATSAAIKQQNAALKNGKRVELIGCPRMKSSHSVGKIAPGRPGSDRSTR